MAGQVDQIAGQYVEILVGLWRGTLDARLPSPGYMGSPTANVLGSAQIVVVTGHHHDLFGWQAQPGYAPFRG